MTYDIVKEHCPRAFKIIETPDFFQAFYSVGVGYGEVRHFSPHNDFAGICALEGKVVILFLKG